MSDLETRLSQKLEGNRLKAALARVRAMPRYATEWERRVVALGPDVDAIDEAIEKLRSMRDPLKCPEEWLFLLAWDLSVDVWDGDWPAEVKRRVCQVSWIVHRYKGTEWAIEQALKAIGVVARLVPWFKMDPVGERGTFEATLYVNENIYLDEPTVLNDRIVNKAVEAIYRTKPLTRHFTFKVGIAASGNLTVAGAMAGFMLGRKTLKAGRPNQLRNNLRMANAVAGCTIQRRTIKFGEV